MPICKKVQVNNTGVCLGDLRHRIAIKTYTITPPEPGLVDFTITKTIDTYTFAAIETVTNVVVFDEESIAQDVSHYFYIRYREPVTFEKKLNYQGKWYRILGTENYENRYRFLRLKCNLRGTERNV